MTRHSIWILFSIFLFQSCAKNQFSLKQYETGNFIAIEKGCRIKFKAYVIDKKIEAKEKKTYYWYFDNKIHHTKGGISGKVLHGNYEAYYPDGQLKAKGEFKDGLKQKTWKDFNEAGYLEYIVNYHDGDTAGKVEHLDANGELVEYVLPFKMAQKAKKKAEKKQNKLIKKQERKKKKENKKLKNTDEAKQVQKEGRFRTAWNRVKARANRVIKKIENKEAKNEKGKKIKKESKKTSTEKKTPKTDKK